MNQELKKILAQVFPTTLPTVSEILEKYPKRDLETGAMVTRIAPSPTGFVHFGGLYAALISERFAHQSKGVFILRIEDTDKKREVAGTATLFAQALNKYHLVPDEGLLTNNEEVGSYGPYHQSARADIYQVFAQELILQDKAYLCFASPTELEELRRTQENLGERSGYWGHFAIWRNKKLEDIQAALDSGLKPVVRLKSPGNFYNKITTEDLLIGHRELPENDQDIVILKTDGLPTYHFAHTIDDHLMGTTHVIRGNEWYPSLPLHLQLFQVLDWSAPQYAHLAPIQKLDNGKKRKLSKRHDPEANLGYYSEVGYPEEAIIEYLLNLANSNFEDWRKANPSLSYTDFPLNWKKLAKSNGPLFDLVKLEDISKNIISQLDSLNLYKRAYNWATQYQPELAQKMTNNEKYIQAILAIERDGVDKPRKDLSCFSKLEAEISYFFDDSFVLDKQELQNYLNDLKDINIDAIIKEFMKLYEIDDNAEVWFEKLKTVALKYQIASSVKDYKNNPEQYKGQIGSIAQVMRLLLTGRTQSPNLCEVMRVLGPERSFNRLQQLSK
ncbi:MAG: glutamate--tRNA ligase family protein [Patescibacteria group bacterium]|jgi:glutamyl-tRNA synthetase|nr:glutamate--tRNA ligase family protein [Patescibacteria group bacterium]